MTSHAGHVLVRKDQVNSFDDINHDFSVYCKLGAHGRAHGPLLPSNMADNIREIITSAVSDTLSRRQLSTPVPCDQPEEPEQDKGKKRRVKILPSSFLKKRKKGNASTAGVAQRHNLLPKRLY